jgi:hypothetical protein
MAYLVGTDEAGYGPNLGPLVIGATLWRVPDGVDGEQLYALLDNVSAPGEQADGNSQRLVIGDSKALYRPQDGLAALERGVFAALRCVQPTQLLTLPAFWRELMIRCDADSAGMIDSIPWYAHYECAVPIDAPAEDVELAQQLLLKALESSGVELLGLRAKIVFPQLFNKRVSECGSKGSALSLWTLELARHLLDSIDGGPILIQCDKHGGRNRYAAILQHIFADHFIRVRHESREQSLYSWGPAERRVEAQFVAKGERLLPAALASMLAKYLRELAMIAFNQFWQQQDPRLKPTAGYPVDARRFRDAIQPRLRPLGIADDQLWRAK